MKLVLCMIVLQIMALTEVMGQQNDTSANISHKDNLDSMDEVVISGTMHAVVSDKSPVLVESYRPAFFRRNVSATLFESIGMINGVRPQLNCSVCNTGDIHLNGMEGPYTLVLIDGMPVISGLGTVYGLNGIPQSLIEKVEVIKGPASSLYGSEAMAGVINIITKKAVNAPAFSAESQLSGWGESNTDIGIGLQKHKISSLSGINFFYFNKPIDKNGDGFTDMALQKRISVFQKLEFNRKEKREASLGLRYIYEDRWGGQTSWTPQWRGSDSIYGESIYTKRIEAIGNYRLPVKLNIRMQGSWNHHNQNAVYGQNKFQAIQSTSFVQSVWNTSAKNQQILVGAGFKSIYYDDNSTATYDAVNKKNAAEINHIPGLFLQDEIRTGKNNLLLLGYRMDHHRDHGFIQSPRIAWKQELRHNQLLRIQAGTGFRVVNLFTEEHAALTGSRNVVITEKIKPERSVGGTLNYSVKRSDRKIYVKTDFALFYTRFSNKIIPDYLTDPNAIIYSNLKGVAIGRGFSMQTDVVFAFPLKFTGGLGYTEVYTLWQNGSKIPQQLSPKWSGTWNLSYTFRKLNLATDFTGQIYGPMHLPVQQNDYRPAISPAFSLMNLQLTKTKKNGTELYFSIKNILNFIPKNPLMRPHDPFDKTAADKSSNPNGYTFDTSYNFAPLQGRRINFGIKFTLK